MFWEGYDPYFATIFFDEVDMVYLAKITANVKKNMNPASFGADFLYDENIDHTEKKSSK